MTPQEIFEYRNKWRPNAHSVPVHSDLEQKCRNWCRDNVKPEQWHCSRYTDVYQHHFLFETAEDAERFAQFVNPEK